MFAVVESGSITSFPSGSRGITINGTQYPASIFTLWSESERNAIGVYNINVDNTNKKNEEYYNNTAITYTYNSDSDTVTGSYGTATAKSLTDITWTQTEIDNGDAPTGATTSTVKQEGLKTIKKLGIEQQCHALLEPSDWRVIKEQETGNAMDSGWKTWRGNMRTKCNSMQTQIDNAANVDALAALFTYTTTDGVTSRPLGEFPVKE